MLSPDTGCPEDILCLAKGRASPPGAPCKGLRLRVEDVAFERREIVVRGGKGKKDRVTVLPENLMLPLERHLVAVMALHVSDAANRMATVGLPDAVVADQRRR